MQQWRKSSHSASEGSCIELACDDGVMSVRDSKRPTAGQLTLPAASVRALLTLLKIEVG